MDDGYNYAITSNSTTKNGGGGEEGGLVNLKKHMYWPTRLNRENEETV